MHSRKLLILKELPVPYRGYKKAIAQNGALKQIILLNAKYIKSI
jgi:hypothetical protein